MNAWESVIPQAAGSEVPRRAFVGSLLALGSGSAAARGSMADESGDPNRVLLPEAVTIRYPAGSSELALTITPRLAGAVHSVRWGGKEFIDSADHGRQLQSACSFDCGKLAERDHYNAEQYNPTEAGARHDHVGVRSTSRLLDLVVAPDALQTVIRMAFWLRPGERSEGDLADNGEALSHHLLIKRIQLGLKDSPHGLRHEATFSVPLGEQHTFAQFESLTGYMPAEFDRFWRYDRSAGKLVPVDQGPGEIPDPVVLATADGGHAMGIFAQPATIPQVQGPTYGRWRFAAERVVKWNAVFRMKDTRRGIPAGEYTFRHDVLVGELATVEALIRSRISIT